MPKKSILRLLQGDNRRTIGRADEVAAIVAKDSALFPELLSSLWSDDLLVRIRAADATEKVTRDSPQFLSPYKKELLGLMADATEQELRWHLAVMIPRLALTSVERKSVLSLLNGYLEDRSSIVKTCALQGLADLAQDDPSCGRPFEASTNATLYLTRRLLFLADLRCDFAYSFIAFLCCLFAFLKSFRCFLAAFLAAFCCCLAATWDWRSYSATLMC